MSSLLRCSSCLRSGFGGKRYKCLICRDFEICAVCYEARVLEREHTPNHAMQCILSPALYDLYFGGETLSNPGQPQSYTCPYCSQMGFTPLTLRDHTTNAHFDDYLAVICPICAAGSEPARYTRRDSLFRHLTLSHISDQQDTTFWPSVAGTSSLENTVRRLEVPALVGRDAPIGPPLVPEDPRTAGYSPPPMSLPLPAWSTVLNPSARSDSILMGQLRRLRFLSANPDRNTIVAHYNRWSQRERDLGRDGSFAVYRHLRAPAFNSPAEAELYERASLVSMGPPTYSPAEPSEPSNPEPEEVVPEPIAAPNFLLPGALAEFDRQDSGLDMEEREARRSFVRELVASAMMTARVQSSGLIDLLEQSGHSAQAPDETTEDTQGGFPDQGKAKESPAK